MMLTFYPLDFVRERVEIDRRQKYPFLMKSDCLLTFFFMVCYDLKTNACSDTKG